MGGWNLASGMTEGDRADSWKLLWDAFMHDSGAVVLMLSVDGRVLFASESAGLWFGGEAATMPGRSLDDLFDASGSAARRAWAIRAMELDRPVVARVVLHGRRRTETFRPLRLPGEEPRIIYTAHDTVQGALGDPRAETIDEQSTSMGPVGQLTQRELQVLTLIAEGLSSVEIAKRMYRSVKTVEAHRARLGQKLRARNRAELTRIAIAAGIVKPYPSPTVMLAPLAATNGHGIWAVGGHDIGTRPRTATDSLSSDGPAS